VEDIIQIIQLVLHLVQTALSFGFKSHTIFVENTGTEPLYLSFDGTNNHGRIKSGGGKVYDFRYEENIWFKCDTDGGAYYVLEAY